ncbi:hypothetical protein PQQ73_18010 [Paraburkholderia strydomiana]|uniref:Uncharacterized protein n=1 Tax=Paraburkholderia strydomiana TaxID=1245417 RepID=A0ABW9EGR6_9BURK
MDSQRHGVLLDTARLYEALGGSWQYRAAPNGPRRLAGMVDSSHRLVAKAAQVSVERDAAALGAYQSPIQYREHRSFIKDMQSRMSAAA